MRCGHHGKKGGLCPVSLGIAIGLTSGLAVFIWSLWILYYGVPPGMAARMMVAPTFVGGLVHALMAFVKGFLFGFFIALFYDLILCCKKSWCGSKDKQCTCNCGCGSCGGDAGCSCGCKSCGISKAPTV